MILKEIKVECVDNRTGLVLKRIKTTEWEQMNRKLAVNNSILNCEKSRIKFDKPIFKAPFQTHHIGYSNKESDWDFVGVRDSQRHANKNNRFFFAFQQRSEKKWGHI